MKKWKKSHRQRKKNKLINWNTVISDKVYKELQSYCRKHCLNINKTAIKFIKIFIRNFYANEIESKK